MKRKLLSLLMALVTALVLIPGPLNAAASEGAAITVSEGAFRGKYVMIAGSGATGLYQIGQDGVLRDSGGNDALFRPDTYTLYLGADGFACGTVTVGQTDETVTAAPGSAAPPPTISAACMPPVCSTTPRYSTMWTCGSMTLI